MNVEHKADIGHAARDQITSAQPLLNYAPNTTRRAGSAREQLGEIAQYLRRGAAGVDADACYRLGIDPWAAKGYNEEAFRRRAADVLDALADRFEQ